MMHLLTNDLFTNKLFTNKLYTGPKKMSIAFCENLTFFCGRSREATKRKNAAPLNDATRVLNDKKKKSKKTIDFCICKFYNIFK